MKFAVGQPVTRIEDTRLIKGEGKFTDDLKLPNMANGVFLRSPYAHANILSIDIDGALKMSGVIDIFTGDRLKQEGLGHMSVIDFLENKDGTPMNASKRPILAIGKVRHVGDPVVFIVAETINQALDASELVEISYEELPCVTDTAKALNKNLLYYLKSLEQILLLIGNSVRKKNGRMLKKKPILFQKLI